MSFNLLVDPIFPVITARGDRPVISFQDLAVQGADAPVDFDWPRPDLNIASYEFAVGVLAVAFQPDPDGWRELWRSPPDAETLTSFLKPLLPAFNLDGEGARFMQAFEELDGGEPSAIEGLFIDTPGINGQKKNTDLLTHRNRFAALGYPAAAMTLYAMQQFAPSGGAGNRTSMRGGGPMTTLFMPGGKDGAPVSLWHKIVANIAPVSDGVELDDIGLRRVFPWMARTILSDRGSGERQIHESDPEVHPLQAYFGMPRRIQLVANGEGACNLTGMQGHLIAGFIQKPWGMNYGLWRHPLTPYRQQKEDSEPYSVKPKSGRFGYRDWVSVTAGNPKGTPAHPSQNIKAVNDRANAFEQAGGGYALLAAGWAMSNMEAIAYLYAEQPLYLSGDEATRDRIFALARNMANAGDVAHDILRTAVRCANFSEGATVSTDGGMFVDVRAAFYENTETPFHAILSRMMTDGGDTQGYAKQWRTELLEVTTTLFDRHAQDPASSQQDGQRRADAYRGLIFGFAGYGPAGKRLFDALNLALPQLKSKSKKENA